MKPFPPFALSLTAFAAMLIQPLAAEDLTYRLDLDDRATSQSPAEERRLPAQTRVDAGLTPFASEGRSGAMVRHDEITSNVMSLNFVRKRNQITLRAGHSLAPNLTRITKAP